MELGSLTAVREALLARSVSAAELVSLQLAHIDAVDTKVGAYLTVDREGARAAAAALDASIAGGDDLRDRPLAGMTLAVKDAFCTRGVRTTCGSKALAGYVPPYDATAVERLRAAGAIVLGKTNMDEFAMGSSTENSAFFPTKNPWDLSRAPGGSSGGSAAAVAARMAMAALGSDTGGSVRQPAAFTGLVGLKPSYGRVSRYGLVAFASSLDVVSPFARSVAEVNAVYSAMAGADPRDSTASTRPVEAIDLAAQSLRGVRVGVPAEYFAEGLSASVEAAVREALSAMAREGATLVPLSMPHTALAGPCYYVLAPAEASSNLARFDGVRYGQRVSGRDLTAMYEATRAEGFGAEVKRRILLGTFVLSAGYYEAYYGKAQATRALIRDDFARAFAACDVIATPTAPTPAFALGAKVADPLAMYHSDVCTLPASLAGVPAVSLPVGLSPEGLPLGMQLMAPWFDEARLLRVAAGVEALFPPLSLPQLQAP